jgi:hypothetical protein
MTDIAIRVENLGKMYRIGAQERRPDNLRLASIDFFPQTAKEVPYVP